MATFTEFVRAVSAEALDTLEGFDEQVALVAGLAPAKVREWGQLHKVYFGSTNAPRQQQAAADKARANALSLDQLAMIERRLKPIADRRLRMQLRLELLDAPGDYNALAALARTIIPREVKPPRKQLTFSRSRSGRRTMTVTADERDLADLEFALTRGLNPRTPAAPQMADAFVRLMREGGGVARAVPRPLLLVPLPEWVRILGGKGNDTVLGLSDGTTTTGAAFLNSHVANAANGLEAAVFHPQEGPVNLYRTQRLANQKQRDLLRATLTACPVPGCRCAADLCEAHHIKAWKHGGATNLDNLSPLCRYHNRTNDDGDSAGHGVGGRAGGARGAPRRRGCRGRIERVGGVPMWRSPRGYAVANPYHPFGAMQTLFH